MPRRNANDKYTMGLKAHPVLSKSYKASATTKATNAQGLLFLLFRVLHMLHNLHCRHQLHPCRAYCNYEETDNICTMRIAAVVCMNIYFELKVMKKITRLECTYIGIILILN